jgi:hypothetical protein
MKIIQKKNRLVNNDNSNINYYQIALKQRTKSTCVYVQLTFGNDETMCCIFPCVVISWMTPWFSHIPTLWIYSTSFFRLQRVMCTNDRRWNEALKSSSKKLKFLQVYNNNVIVKVNKRLKSNILNWFLTIYVANTNWRCIKRRHICEFLGDLKKE